MIQLIADSGSTKTDWILLEGNEIKAAFSTAGLNPYFNTSEEISHHIEEGCKKVISGFAVNAVHFYGAGCGRPSTQKLMTATLQRCFPEAAVNVASDLLGAARACLGRREGLVCILGTGSNSGLYNGREIVTSLPSLGFALGDEASGGYFGRKILNSYFYRQMPEELRTAFEKKYALNLEIVLDQVYKQVRPNQYVASFSAFLFEHGNHPFFQEMLRAGFEEFIGVMASYFGDLKGKNIAFAGSIAAQSELLKKVLNEREITLDIIIQKPIEKLVDYHL